MRIRSDTVIGAILVTLVAVLLAMTFYLPSAPYGTMGPALFPRTLLIVLLPLCLVLFLKGLFQDLREQREALRPFSEWLEQYRNVLVSYVLFFFFALALPYAGYLITGLLFLFLMQLALGPKTWRNTLLYLLVTIGVLAFLFILFRCLLLVFLPQGVFSLDWCPTIPKFLK